MTSLFPSWTTIVAVFGTIGSLSVAVFVLTNIVNKLMDKVMERRIEKALLRRRLANDTFRDENGYSWDLVLAFPVHRKFAKISPEQRLNSTKYILSRLLEGDLEFRLFYNTKHDLVYCKVRASTHRLMMEADRINFKVAYDSSSLESLCKTGRPGLWEGLKIPDTCVETKLKPYAHIYGSFKYDPETKGARSDLANVYKRWKSIRLGTRVSFSTPSPLAQSEERDRSRVNGGALPVDVDVDETGFGGFIKVEDMLYFRSTDRLKLIDSIINNKTPGGCCLDINELRASNCVTDYLVLHDHVQLFTLERYWLKLFQFPWNQAVDHVREYFGERIGLFFVFLGHQTTWLIGAAVVGTGCWINVAVKENDPNALIMPYFAAFISLWTTFYLDSLRMTERKTAQRWGMVGFEELEQERPEFQGIDIRSPVTGKMTTFFPQEQRFRRSIWSYAAVLTSLTVAVGVLAFLLFLRMLINYSNAPRGFGEIITSVFIAIQIDVLNYYYVRYAILLNNYENHRTETVYEDALIAKTFIFQFINSFGCLFYIAFVQQFLSSNDPCIGNCYQSLQLTLGSIFISRLLIGNAAKVVLPMLTAFLNSREALANMSTPNITATPVAGDSAPPPSSSTYEQEEMLRRDMSDIEKSFLLAEFDPLLGTFNDYANVANQFGFTTMFVTAFPLTAPLALVNNYVEMRVNAWRLCQTFRRPMPRSAEDIGTWFLVFELISIAAVLTNAGLICFTGTYMVQLSWTMRVWIFIIMSGAILLLKTVIHTLRPHVSSDVAIQLKRSEFINQKVENNLADDVLKLTSGDIRFKPSWRIFMSDKISE